MACVACLLLFLQAGTEPAAVAAQISPLSPLSRVDSGAPALALTQRPLINVLASGQAALARLALLLLAVVASAALLLWRQP